jgi:putative flippase GtrA
MSGQFLRFLLANTFAAMMNIGVRFLGHLFIVDFFAVVLGSMAGITTSYLLCRRFVFHQSRNMSWSEAARFLLVNLIMLLITWLVYQGVFHWLQLSLRQVASVDLLRTVAHSVGVAAPAFLSFAAQKTFTFRQHLR